MIFGSVYKIINNISNEIYIGSTLKTLSQRFAKHKYTYNEMKNNKKRRVLHLLFDKHGINNFQIILIKTYEIVDRKHLTMYEQLWINKLAQTNNLVNMCSAFSIEYLAKKKYNKQYRNINNDKIKQYRLKNKIKKNEYNKVYRLKCKAKNITININ